jgi:hypothetical protein
VCVVDDPVSRPVTSNNREKFVEIREKTGDWSEPCTVAVGFHVFQGPKRTSWSLGPDDDASRLDPSCMRVPAGKDSHRDPPGSRRTLGTTPGLNVSLLINPGLYARMCKADLSPTEADGGG